jgi:hypothetical protein
MVYEFSEEQNRSIMELNKWLKALSLLLVVFGLLAFGISFAAGFDIYILIIGFILLGSGIFFYLPNDNFKKIVQTKGNDIEELMITFKELNVAWTILFLGMALLLLNTIIQTIRLMN